MKLTAILRFQTSPKAHHDNERHQTGAARGSVDTGCGACACQCRRRAWLHECCHPSRSEAQGYAVSEVKLETDQIEVEAEADRQSFEIEISPATVKGLAVEEDDEDEDDT